MDETLLEAIHRLDQEIHEQKMVIARTNEGITAIIEDTDAHQSIVQYRQYILAAKEELKKELAGNSSYLRATEDLAEEKLKLKDLKDIMSHNLRYYRENDATQVPMTNDHRAKQLLVTAKLGKEEAFQEQLRFK
jgi:FlaA1/EpsC-like NDP-sugar epimerase